MNIIGPKFDYDDVHLVPKRYIKDTNLTGIDLPSRDIPLERIFHSRWHSDVLTGVPIIASNMDHTGTTRMTFALSKYNVFTALHKFYTIEQLAWLFSPTSKPTNEMCSIYDCTWVSIGARKRDIEFLQALEDALKPTGYKLKINIDVANGYLYEFVNFIKFVRDTFPKAWIMAGNVATYEVAQDIILHGADFVKIGIGPGSVCKTRDVTGVGYPQLSAVIECADAVHGVGGLICADGGCKVSGDIAKAIAGGADMVMLGGMLAGHEECGDEILIEGIDNITEQPVKMMSMEFYGMSSKEANDKYFGGLKGYRASEGTCISVPFKGPVSDTIEQIMGGIRSCMTLTGAKKVEDMRLCSTFCLKYNRGV